MEIIQDDKQLLFFDGKKEFSFSFEGYNDLNQLFSKKFIKIKKAKKKVKMAYTDILNIWGFSIIFLSIFIGLILPRLDNEYLDGKKVYVILVFLGIGGLFLFPKSLKKYLENERFSITDGKSFAFSFCGLLFVLVGIYHLLR